MSRAFIPLKKAFGVEIEYSEINNSVLRVMAFRENPDFYPGAEIDPLDDLYSCDYEIIRDSDRSHDFVEYVLRSHGFPAKWSRYKEYVDRVMQALINREDLIVVVEAAPNPNLRAEYYAEQIDIINQRYAKTKRAYDEAKREAYILELSGL